MNLFTIFGGWLGAVCVLSLSVGLLAHRTEAEVRYVNPEYGFELAYAEEAFEERQNDAMGVALILGARKGGFPTFTVAVSPGAYRPRSSTDHADQILDEYRRVGFHDAQVVEVFRYTHRGAQLLSPQVVLLFTNNDLYLRSKVVFISTPTRHFVLTYMDYADRDDDGESEELFDNFVIRPISGNGEPRSNVQRRERDQRATEEGGLLGELGGWLYSLSNSITEAPSVDEEGGTVSAFDQNERYDFDERAVESPDVRARPSFSRTPKLPLPSSTAGRLLSLLALFSGGVLVKRWKRG